MTKQFMNAQSVEKSINRNCLLRFIIARQTKRKKLQTYLVIIDQVFTTRAQLNAHTRYVTGKSPFTCYICNNFYTSNSGLLYHFSKCHEGAPLFFCKACDLGFYSKKEINDHEKESVHRQNMLLFDDSTEETKVKKHKCQKCEYSNDSLTCLKRHIAMQHLS